MKEVLVLTHGRDDCATMVINHIKKMGGECTRFNTEEFQKTVKITLDLSKSGELMGRYYFPEKIEKILDLLEDGKNLALVSDAGTPGISDPGGFLVKKIFEKFGNEVKIVPIPGANAAIVALSISGFLSDQFKFLGFPPHKKGRKTFFENIAKEECVQVFYESKHRIQKALLELKKVMPERELVLCRELTKQFETTYRGNAESCLKQLEADKILGEFVVVIAGK